MQTTHQEHPFQDRYEAYVKRAVASGAKVLSIEEYVEVLKHFVGVEEKVAVAPAPAPSRPSWFRTPEEQRTRAEFQQLMLDSGNFVRDICVIDWAKASLEKEAA